MKQKKPKGFLRKKNELASPISLGWVFGLTLSILLSIGLGLCIVWLSIEGTDMAYTLRKLQNELTGRIAFKNKLEVERERLLAPFELVKKAQEFGMHEATIEEVRKLK